MCKLELFFSHLIETFESYPQTERLNNAPRTLSQSPHLTVAKVTSVKPYSLMWNICSLCCKTNYHVKDCRLEKTAIYHDSQ